MDKAALMLERRQAAAAIAWPERTPFLVNPDPIVRKKLKKLGIFLGVVALFWAVVSDSHGPLQNWGRSMDNQQMRPSMEAAMKAGNRAAGTWLAVHFHQDYPGLLQQEADAGEPSAMFLMGRILMQHDHPERFFTIDPAMTASQVKAKGLSLVRRAAAAGNQDALLFAVGHGGV